MANRPMHPYSPKHSGFTLIEVLVATAVTAMLMSAITLNLGVRDNLLRVSASGQPKEALQSHLDAILENKTLAQLDDYVGTPASTSDLSDPASTPARKLVAITQQSVGTSPDSVTVLSIEVSSGANRLSRWLAPVN